MTRGLAASIQSAIRGRRLFIPTKSDRNATGSALHQHDLMSIANCQGRYCMPPTKAASSTDHCRLFEFNAKLIAARPSHLAILSFEVVVDGELKYLGNIECSVETNPSAVR